MVSEMQRAVLCDWRACEEEAGIKMEVGFFCPEHAAKVVAMTLALRVVLGEENPVIRGQLRIAPEEFVLTPAGREALR